MKDKGQQVGRTPAGNPMSPKSLYPESHPYPPAGAFYAGHNAYLLGHPETHNPHTDERLAHEWKRGYRNTRKQDRFKATIAARQKK
jgi:hypothetical protein